MGALFLPAIVLTVAWLPSVAAAHVAGASDIAPIGWSAAVVLLLGASAMLYAIGVRRLWQRAGARRGVSLQNVVLFAIGWSVLAMALVSPIDAFADRSFALHMVQHELIMLVAAPLLVLARPLEAFTWAVSPAMRRVAGRVGHSSVWVTVRHGAGSQTGAWCLHAAALWIWHVPALFLAAMSHPALHVLQHTCFFASALLFWWSVLRSRAYSRSPGAMAAVLTTMLHTSALGALLALASHAWYVAPDAPILFGISALEDQQLGGLIMWVPGSVAYVVAALFIAARWLGPRRINRGLA